MQILSTTRAKFENRAIKIRVFTLRPSILQVSAWEGTKCVLIFEEIGQVKVEMAAEVQSPPKPAAVVESPEMKSFGSRLTELPVVMAAMGQLSQIYSTVRERNSVTKMAFGAGETAVQTAAAATKPLLTCATNTAFTLAKPVIGQVDEPGTGSDTYGILCRIAFI